MQEQTAAAISDQTPHFAFDNNTATITYPLSGSRAIALGSSSSEEIRLRWLLPFRSDTDILSFVVSVQYNWDVLHSTASPSQTPIPVIIVAVLAMSMWKRLIFCSNTSLQNMYPKLKWTSMATALVNSKTTEFTADIL